jgi:hypothetical protein
MPDTRFNAGGSRSPFIKLQYKLRYHAESGPVDDDDEMVLMENTQPQYSLFIFYKADEAEC